MLTATAEEIGHERSPPSNSSRPANIQGLNSQILTVVDGFEDASVKLPLSTSLRDWILYHSLKNKANVEGPRVMGGCMGTLHMGSGKKMDKDYLEKAARVALSLAIKLEKLVKANRVIDEKIIVIDNVVVNDTENDEADFVRKERSTSANATNPSDTTFSQGQRLKICALGRIFFELFTQGSAPLPSSREGITLKSRFKSTASRFGTSTFQSALHILGGDSEDDNHDTERSGAWKQPRRSGQGKEKSARTMLQLAGLPSSICRLVADMLENDYNSEGLFCHDQSITSGVGSYANGVCSPVVST